MLKTSNFPLRIHEERSLSTDKLKAKDWMAPKNIMIAVLEYCNGYFFPMFDWTRNHEDHKTVPATKAKDPEAHLAFLVVNNELSLLID